MTKPAAARLPARWRYYRRQVRAYRAYRAGRARLDYLPVRLWIEATSDCNLACVMCPNKDLPAGQKGFMDFELFRKIVDEARGFAFDVHLLHRGESLLHPRFFDMVRYAHEAGLVTRFHTNGTLLDADKAVRLIEAGLQQFAFSFDGGDKESYERIRVGADFETTVANMVGFLETKKRLGSRTPRTIIELIGFPDQRTEEGRARREAFAARFKGLPLDRIVVKELHNWAGDRGRGERRSPYTPCTFLWQALIVFWDGAVLPCTQDFFGANALGNVRDASLAEIWNGERMVRLREMIVKGEVAGLEACSMCDRLYRKTFLGVPREYLGRMLLKKME